MRRGGWVGRTYQAGNLKGAERDMGTGVSQPCSSRSHPGHSFAKLGVLEIHSLFVALRILTTGQAQWSADASLNISGLRPSPSDCSSPSSGHWPMGPRCSQDLAASTCLLQERLVSGLCPSPPLPVRCHYCDVTAPSTDQGFLTERGGPGVCWPHPNLRRVTYWVLWMTKLVGRE